MNRKPIFDLIRVMLKRGVSTSETKRIDAAIDEGLINEIVVIAPKPAVPKPSGAIGLIDVSVLKAAAPEKPAAELSPWVEPIRAACVKFDINNIRRIASFLTYIAHEAKFVAGKRENMNYSADRMAAIWPSRFRGPNALARALHRKPEEIANHVYANRMGNGPPASGDGWKYRGNSAGQLTGYNNHKGFADAMGMTIDAAIAYMATIEGAVMSAAWFWEENDINRLADTPGVADETRRINGGTIGLEDRTERFNRTVARLLELEK